MESKAKIAGHPIHQMLIVFPLGLLIMALVFDILYFITGNSGFATAAFWDIPAGIIGGLVAAVFAISWLLRWGAPDGAPGLAAFVPALLAVGLGAVTGWLGGELVDRLGVGVSPGANLDAPSSLTAPAAGRAGEAPPRQAHS